MSGHKLGYEITQHAQHRTIADPGASGTISDVEGGGTVILKTNTTYNLIDPDNLPTGQMLTAVCAVASCQIDCPNLGAAVMNLAAGEVGILVIGEDASGVKEWRGVILKEGLS